MNKFIIASLMVAAVSSQTNPNAPSYNPSCQGTMNSPCPITAGANGLLLAVPFYGPNFPPGRAYDWEPFNLEYFGMTHPQSRGIGAWVNTTYFSIAQTIDNSGYALKGNFFSGDLAKDNSDLSQAGSGDKCPVTVINSACNLLGQCIDYFPPTGDNYVFQFEMMMTNYHIGFNFSNSVIAGPNIGIVYVGDYTGGAWYIAEVPPLAVTQYVLLTQLTPVSDLRTNGELFSWSTWTINYMQPNANGGGYFNVTRNGVFLGSADLTNYSAGSARRLQAGVQTINYGCQTADFEFYLRNVVAYLSRSGVVDKVAATADLSFYSPPFPFLNGSDVNLNDNINLYKPYYPLPTIDGPAAQVASTTLPTTSATSSGAQTSSAGDSSTSQVNNVITSIKPTGNGIAVVQGNTSNAEVNRRLGFASLFVAIGVAVLLLRKS